MKTNKTLCIILLTILAVFVIGCTQQTAPQPPQPTAAMPEETSSAATSEPAAVDIRSFKFFPADLHVKTGATVTWTNKDPTTHTVESADGTIKSDELHQGDSWSFTFTTPGTFDYACGLHSSMKGRVTVE